MSSVPLTARSGRIRRAARLATRSYRDKTGEFLVEGPQAVRAALALPGCVAEVFATERAGHANAELATRARHDGITWTTVDGGAIESIADTVSPQGLVARARQVTRDANALLPLRPGRVLVAVDIRDPGNCGSLVRIADAAGADALVLAGDCVDIHNPKAVRSSAGSIFQVPVITEHDTSAALEQLSARGLQVLATDSAGTVSLFSDDLDLGRPTAWVIGNEAHGFENTHGIAEYIDSWVCVPIFGSAESLNLATAAAVCLYTHAQYAHAQYAQNQYAQNQYMHSGDADDSRT